MIAGIYALLNIINGKYYTSSAVDFKDRWRLHLFALNNSKHHNRHLQKAWNKYGADNFIFVVLQYSDNWLEQLEQHWIDKLDATNIDLGYNICKAGRNRFGVKASEETRAKLSAAHKGKIPSAETRAKMSQSRLGNQINKGRIQTEAHKKAISESRKGHSTSEETRAKIGAGNLGKTISAETRLKMSIAAKNRKRPIDNFKDCGHILQDVAP
jgi:group I intron endonuclease